MTQWKGFCTLLAAGLAVLLLGQTSFAWSVHLPRKAKKARPRVEVVFCLDTTGSMGGLIEGAKQKIWSMCNQIAGGQPTPDLKVGLVAYRDRGDQYVTRTYDLTNDLDAIHGHLMGFQASGGGDGPESVNEALHVALNQVQWSKDKGVLRIIYLVGDAPPHMDYANDTPYSVTCTKAAERGIIINTIQCGSDFSTTPIWKEIAQKAEGKYVQIAQDGAVQTVCTPFDNRLAEINTALTKTALPYGSAMVRAQAEEKLWAASMPTAVTCTTSSTTIMAPATGASARLTPGVDFPGISTSSITAAAPAAVPVTPVFATMAADRAAYCAKTGRVSALDLVDGIKEGKIKLEDLKTEELPDEMQKLTPAERKAYLAKVAQDRAKLQTEALELDRKRAEYISQELRGKAGTCGFDSQVMEMLREQAKKHNIAY